MLYFVIAVLFFGPKKLPEIGRQLGKGLGEFKRASNDLKRSIEDEIDKASKEEPAAPSEAPKPAVAAVGEQAVSAPKDPPPPVHPA